MFEKPNLIKTNQEQEKVPYNIKIFQEQSSPEGGGDGYFIERKNFVTEISIFDLQGHGSEVAEKAKLITKEWETIKKNYNEKEWYKKLDTKLSKIGISSSMGIARLIEKNSRKKLELFIPAGEIFIIVRDNKTGKVWFNLSENSHTNLKTIFPEHEIKLGFPLPESLKNTINCQKKDISKILNLSNDAQIIMFTDGIITGKWGQGDPINFEKDLQKLAINKKLSGDEFFRRLETMARQNLEDTKNKYPDERDDATMVCLRTKY